MHSLTYNGTAFNTYGLIVRLPTPSPTLVRTYDSIQVQDRSWAGKGQAGPSVFSLPVVIVGTSAANCLLRVSTIRGLLDQEEECALSFDMYTDRYWMAKFDSLEGNYTAPTVWEGMLIFTCHDGKAYANAPIVGAPQTFALNESADYGTILGLCFDDDFVYVSGATTNKVYKLNKKDLAYVAIGPDYGGLINCICCDDSATGYIYYGGNGGAGQYDIVKLDKATMTIEVRGPDYGGQVFVVSQLGNYIYYGGNGGAGQYDVCKLLKSDMTTIVRSSDYGGEIYALDATNPTYIFYGGGTTKKVRKTDVATMAANTDSASYGGDIYGIAIDAVNVYCGGGTTQTIKKHLLTTMATIASSSDLGSQVCSLSSDDTYIYAGLTKIYKILKSDLSLVAISESYGGGIYENAIDGSDLYIGGTVTKKVWKLDTRHMPLVVSSDSYGSSIRAMLVKDNYLYIAGAMDGLTGRVLKLRVSDLVKVAESADYGGYVYAMAADSLFLYIGGTGSYKVFKLSIVDLEKVCESATYTGIIWHILVNSTHVFIGGETLQKVRQLLISDLSTVVDSGGLGATIQSMALNSTHLYASNGTNVYKMLVTDLSAVANVACAMTFSMAINSTHLIGTVGHYVKKLLLADFATITASADFGGNVWSVSVDDTYVYASTQTIQRVFKLLLSDLSTIAFSRDYGSLIYVIAIDGGNIYVQNGAYGIGTMNIEKLDKRVLWRRSDHNLTVTTVGTARTNPVITITMDGANYWAQVIENTTLSQEFTWEGTVANTDILEVDSTMWSVELNGVSAMSGQSGDFLQLSPGANVLYFENVVGMVEVDYTDRFA